MEEQSEEEFISKTLSKWSSGMTNKEDQAYVIRAMFERIKKLEDYIGQSK